MTKTKIEDYGYSEAIAEDREVAGVVTVAKPGENCPHCGAPKSESQPNVYDLIVDYDCGSVYYGRDQEWSIGFGCLQNQLEAAQARIRELEERCQSLAAHAVLDKNRIEALEAWGRKAYKFIDKMVERELLALELHLPNSISIKLSQEQANELIKTARDLGLVEE